MEQRPINPHWCSHGVIITGPWGRDQITACYWQYSLIQTGALDQATRGTTVRVYRFDLSVLDSFKSSHLSFISLCWVLAYTRRVQLKYFISKSGKSGLDVDGGEHSWLMTKTECSVEHWLCKKSQERQQMCKDLGSFSFFFFISSQHSGVSFGKTKTDKGRGFNWQPQSDGTHQRGSWGRKDNLLIVRNIRCGSRGEIYPPTWRERPRECRRRERDRKREGEGEIKPSPPHIDVCVRVCVCVCTCPVWICMPPDAPLFMRARWWFWQRGCISRKEVYKFPWFHRLRASIDCW